jgi:hypothetical protein
MLDVVTVAALATATPPGPTLWTDANHEITAVMVKPRDAPDDPQLTADNVRSNVSTVSTLWSDNSEGGVSFSVAKVEPLYSSTYTCGSYAALWNEAAAKTGWVKAANRHLVLFVPAGTQCGSVDGVADTAGVNSGGRVLIRFQPYRPTSSRLTSPTSRRRPACVPDSSPPPTWPL